MKKFLRSLFSNDETDPWFSQKLNIPAEEEIAAMSAPVSITTVIEEPQPQNRGSFMHLERQATELSRIMSIEERHERLKKEKALEAAAVNRAIHEAVYGAHDNLIANLSKQLEDLVETEDEKLAAQMEALGFGNAEGVRDLSQKTRLREEVKKRLELARDYQIRYPLNRFITMKKMKEIGAKYGLLIASACKYKADIPKKNMEEIINFRVNKNDISLDGLAELFYGRINMSHFHHYHRISGRDPFGAEHLYRFIEVPEHAEDWLKETVDQTFRRAKSESMPGCLLVVMAPSSKLDTSEMIEVNGTLVNLDDPIVLQPVHEGFLIITSWGLEAQDPDVMNPITN